VIRPGTPGTGAAEVARHYDELDPWYRELWGEHVHHGLWISGTETPAEAVEGLIHRVAAEAGIGPGTRVCDIGCGYGGTARLLAGRYGARVDGVTVSPVQAGYARATLAAEDPAPPIRIHAADWMDAGLPSRSFEAALAIESLTHMPDPARALAEAHRVLVPGGRLVACVWLADPGAGPVAERVLLEPICREGRLAGLPTSDEVVALMHGAGFEAVEVDDLSHAVRRTWTLTLAAAARRLAGDPEARRFILDRRRSERVFAWTMARIWVAYRLGVLRYGLFTARAANDGADARDPLGAPGVEG